MARYAKRTLEKMHALANSSEELKEASEVRRTLDVVLFDNEWLYRGAMEVRQLYEKHVPEDRGQAQYLNAEEAQSKYAVKTNAGAIVVPNGAVWPYRLITRLWEQLSTQYGSRLSIETETHVTEIIYDTDTNPSHPYT